MVAANGIPTPTRLWKTDGNSTARTFGFESTIDSAPSSSKTLASAVMHQENHREEGRSLQACQAIMIWGLAWAFNYPYAIDSMHILEMEVEWTSLRTIHLSLWTRFL